MSGSAGAADAMSAAENGVAISGVQQGYCHNFRPFVVSYGQPYNGGAGGMIQSGATACGSSYPSSFNSFELPTITPPLLPQPDFYVAAAAAQANDFYYHSSQPRYADSPLTSAELCGAGTRSASPVMGYGATPSIAGINGYGYTDQAAGSVFSSCSFSGSRFPQWYLPRGYYSISCSNVVGGSCGSGYGLYADCASSGITPTSVSMGQNSAEEEMLSSSHGRSHYVMMPPPPPRLSPQSSSGTLVPFALPPSYAATAAGNDAHAIGVPPTYPSGVMELSSSASLSTSSPVSRAARAPQFLSYDGRAYDIPPCKAHISSADAAAAVTQCSLVACAQHGGYSPVDASQPIRMSTQKSGTPHDMHAYPRATSPLTQRPLPHSHRRSTGAASEPAERSCSPEESALLADVHARLMQQHRSSQLLKERSAAQRAGVKPLSRSDLAAPAKGPASGKKVVANGSSHEAASTSSMAAEEAAVAALSPIPRLPAAGAVDAEASDQSLWGGDEAAAQAPTQDALDRLLTVPGVVWRHDPYSRIVLPQTQATVESDGSEATSTSCSSLPAGSPYVARATLGFSDRGDARANVTQPPRSPDIAAGANGSSSNSADGVRPSPRRLPTKKVCVRHYVNGDGDLSLSHEHSGVVGALLSVREAAPTATVPVALFASGASAPLRHSAFMDDDDDGAAPAAPPETEPITVLTVTASAPAERGKPSVPKPRSKQVGLPASARGAKAGATKEDPVVSTDSSSCVSCASGHLKASHVASPSTLDAVVLAEAPGKEDLSPASGVVGASADPAAAAGVWPAVRRPGPYSSPLGFSAARSAYQSASRWGWRPRSARVYALAQPAEMASTKEELLAADLADLDTSYLLGLWQKLDSSGCFRDALELRRCVIGPGSNSSTRVLRRMLPLSRRLMNRRRGLEVESGDGPRFTVLDESEMKYVCLLQHRFRKSTAVASEHYAPGTMVVVDGDMGVDTGIVTLSMTRDEYEAMTDVQRRAAHLVVHLEFSLAASIHRAALADEILMHGNTQLPLEEATLEFLRYLTTQPHLFQSCRVEWMHFVDVEFQADGQKLYVHYTSDTPVRFLELATFLNHIFHCRIWMKVVKEEDW
ncbi:PSP1 C-inal conserved region containing protein [Leishmania donovani]|uniref:PSP1_C-inal_conserved_region_containing_protein_p utative/Pfam:PF04468 n=1 Tax=Leishmania donovani TaxID=5661 RepID=A0A6J8FFA0_LEIDO|nr:PSP1 C-inal conserved region containing protein [Leishmania donovani]VDZ46446.1 PSP1_C-inal_conserved_region_containing_protein_putative/Pfam:PF04468 [Leishmania donovani]